MDVLNEVIEEKFSRCPRCRSYSVKLTKSLTFKERLKALFVPVSAYTCGNCSSRFVECGKFSARLKNVFSSLFGRGRGKWLTIAAALLIAAAVSIFLVLSWGVKPVLQIDKEISPQKEIKQETAPAAQKITPPPPREEKKIEAEKKETPRPAEPIAEIVLGTSNRFGVNWRVIEGGVQITRMSAGPLKQAGLMIGDILSEADGKKIIDGSYLLKIRNEIFHGRRAGALVKVLRNGKTYLYKLVKNAGDGSPVSS
jgi:hypothetical protein